MSKIASIIARMQKKAGVNRSTSVVEADEADVPVGMHGVLASTEKLLAMNKGLVEPDERDSLQFKKFFTPDKLLRERVRLDNGHLRRTMMRHVAKSKSLKGVTPFIFDEYALGGIVGNPLASPLEEINPLQLHEQANRSTQMGPGGIGSDDALTESMQAVQPSAFGFIDALAGPECFDNKSEVYTLRGWVPWTDVRDDEVFACRVAGRLEWHTASRVIREDYTGPMVLAESKSARMCVTPNHRVVWSHGRCPAGSVSGFPEHTNAAESLIGRGIKVPVRHLPCLGDEQRTTFQLPTVEKTNNNQREYSAFAIEDWAELLGWWLAEGAFYEGIRSSSRGSQYTEGSLTISQCPVANPEKYARIRALMIRMGLIGHNSYERARAFSVTGKQFRNYFKQWDKGCYEKWIPEECFYYPLRAREKMLEALVLGDGRSPRNRLCYCTVSRRLAESVERLAFGLGYSAYIRVEQDKRPHVKTTNYVVSMHRQPSRQFLGPEYKYANGKKCGGHWSIVQYSGKVYCATVPGGLLHVRGSCNHGGFWSGNSARAGVDVRFATGVKIGSDGMLYQRFRDRKTNKLRWLNPRQASEYRVKFPD